MRAVGFLIAALSALGTALAADLTGAGTSFPYPIYARWGDDYRLETGIELHYQAIGSGGGIQRIKARKVTFGASDLPLSPRELQAAGLVQFPMVLNGVVLAVNLEGFDAGQLVLDGPTLAAIYLGDIRAWNDPAIQALNPTVVMPARPIHPVHRADGSITNFLFSSYLSQESATFHDKGGIGTVLDWPAGLAVKGGNAAEAIALTPGAIGYLEYAYARQNRLLLIDLINKAGHRIPPTPASFVAAVGPDALARPDFDLALTDSQEAAAWPIVGASFILMPQTPPDGEAATQALLFFSWAYEHGTAARELDYVPLPAPLIRAVRSHWALRLGFRGAP